MGAVSSKRIASESGELENRARANLPSDILTKSDMLHTKSHLDVNKERERQKQKLDTKQEQLLLHPRQTSGIDCHSPESLEEGGVRSCKNVNEKDSDVLMQISNSNPAIPAQVSNPVPVSHAMEDSSKIPKDEERTTEKLEAVGGTSIPAQSVNGVPASLSNEKMLIKNSQSGKILEKLQPRRIPDAVGYGSQPDQLTITSAHPEKNCATEAEPRAHNPRPSSHALMSKEEKVTNTKQELIMKNSVQASSLSIGVPVPHLGQESNTYSKMLKKVEKLQPRRNPDPIVQESKSDVGTTPSKTPEKGLDDGYNWRKYGQKLVKGNKFVRSYYRCTHLNCQAKKQVEKSHGGCISDINYLGNHHHQKPQHSPQATSTLQERSPEMPIASTSKTNFEVICKQSGLDQHMALTETSPQSTQGRNDEGLSGAVSCSKNNTRDVDDFPESKRQKRDTSSVDEDVGSRSSSDSRHVVQTLSEVDLVNDGNRWRKYGQKLVKGNPNPRSYYRCSSTGCPAKKHVERASHNPKLVITTYEGKHHHEIPTSSTVSQSTSRVDSNMMKPNGELSSKPEDKSPVSREIVVHVTAN